MTTKKQPPGRTETPTGRMNHDTDTVTRGETEGNCISLAEQAEEIMRGHGLTPVGPLTIDGLLHHVDVEGDRTGSGHLWYRVTRTPRPVVIFGDFKHRLPQDKVVAALHNGGVPSTPAENAAWERAIEAAKRAIESEQRRVAQTIQSQAAALPNAESSNAYLTRKWVSSCPGLKEDTEGRLFVPVYDLESGETITAQQIEADGSKKFLPGGRTKGGAFVIGGPDGGARLPSDAETVFLAEGLATGLTVSEAMDGAPVVVCFSAGNLMAVANILAKTLPRHPQTKGGRLKVRICLCADNDRGTEVQDGRNPGIEVGRRVAKRHGFHFAYPDFSLAGNSSDFNDLFIERLELADRENSTGLSAAEQRGAALAEVRQQIDLALTSKPLCFNETEAVDHLMAVKSEAERERVREEIAAAMGSKVAWLKKAETNLRKGLARQTSQLEANLNLPFTETAPHGEPVDGGAALEEAGALLTRHVLLPDHLVDLAAVWALGTHVAEQFDHFARVHITSNSENSGKTTLGECIMNLAARGFSTTSPSRAALLRDLGLRPTVFLDEAENWLHLDEVYCAILNEGFRRGGNLRRCVEVLTETGATGFVAKGFPVYSPVILAGIGELPKPSLASRCLQFHLTPAPYGRQPAPFDDESRKAAKTIAGKFARWAADNREKIQAALASPDSAMGVNRNRQIARPLLALAHTAGGGWGERVRRALEKLWEANLPDPGLAMRLLLAVLDLFTAVDPTTGKARSNRTPVELADGLIAMSDYAWARERRGDPIDAAWVRSILRREFRLNVRRCRRPEGLVYAYIREDLHALVDTYRDRLRDAARVLRLGTEGTLQVLGLDSQPEG